MATVSVFSKGITALLASSALLGLRSASPAGEPVPAPPAPPTLVLPDAPVPEHSADPSVPEPGEPRGRVKRGGTPGTLIENGESGAGGVEDYTDPAYDLLQDGVAGQGDYAFHLAKPDAQKSDWFKLTPSVAVTNGCKLFFQSRLGWASTTQTATVQVSTDGGSTWPSTLWTQSGDGGSGESGFSLKEVDLSAFAGQTIQIRFLYAFSGGNYFPQVQDPPPVGWYIDNIQIGSALSKEQYLSFGDPTDHEQHYLEYINRARASAAAEAVRLRDESDPLITSAYSGSGIDLDDIPTQFAWHVNNSCMDEFAQPLTFNAQLLQMSGLHTQDMFDNIFQGHVSSASPPAPFQAGDTLGDRRTRVGYGSGVGENVYAYAKSVAHGHAGFDVDWGGTTNTGSSCYNPGHAGQGMQNPPGHRLSIHNADYREIGIGVINGSNGSVGPQIVTQNFGTGGGIVVTGVVYQDGNSNNFYDPGEGIGGVRVETPDSAFFSITSSSGGYAIPVESNGTHPVTFSGGGVPTSTANAVVSDGNNAKLDYLPTSTGGGYSAWATSLGVTGGENGDHEPDGVPNLVEYAIAGFDPLTHDASRLPSLVMSGGGTSTLTVDKNTSASGVSYAVETSIDMISWTGTGHTVLVDDATTFQVSIPQATAGRLFVRIVISSTP